jgi:hypothetical protein
LNALWCLPRLPLASNFKLAERISYEAWRWDTTSEAASP